MKKRSKKLLDIWLGALRRASLIDKFFCALLLHKKKILPFFELAILIAIWWLADRAAQLLHLPLPGAVLGLFLLVAAFALKLIHPDRLRQGSNLLLRHLLLFFIPPMLVLRAHADMVGWLGLKLLAIIIIGTVAVLSATGLAVQFMMRNDR